MNNINKTYYLVHVMFKPYCIDIVNKEKNSVCMHQKSGRKSLGLNFLQVYVCINRITMKKHFYVNHIMQGNI